MKVIVIIPTYNECENIARLIEAIRIQFHHLASRMPAVRPGILVVDDHSPDGTAERVRSLQHGSSGIHLIEGEKAGLGAAYIRGMTHAVEVLAADVVFEMDADFSHRPEDIPRLLERIVGGADLVIGSRYVPGGSIPAGWGWRRRLNSRGGNLLARYGAGLGSVRDCTAGFRAIRTGLLKRIDLSRLGVKGYVFQVALLHAAIRQGARVEEVPVDFVERAHGASKLRLADIVEFVRHVFRLRLHDSQTFIRFGLVGALGVIVNLGAFTILLGMEWNRYVASPLAVELAIASNFLLNNFWTFRQRASRDPFHLRGLKFNLVSVVTLSVSTLAFVLTSRAFRPLSPQLCQLAGVVPAWFANYTLNSRWTFREADARPASR